MPMRQAKAVWEGDLASGKGTFELGSGACKGTYSFKTRMEGEPGSNPEELIGAALASCFSMALSAGLAKAGTPPTRIATQAEVTFEKQGEGWAIARIDLTTDGEVPGLDETAFQKAAEEAKRGCPVSKALGGTEIRLQARLAAGVR